MCKAPTHWSLVPRDIFDLEKHANQKCPKKWTLELVLVISIGETFRVLKKIVNLFSISNICTECLKMIFKKDILSTQTISILLKYE